jgi:hypothetical protein
MVLRLATTLVGAHKGLLLLKREDGDGLDLAAAEGFGHDPAPAPSFGVSRER